MEGWVISYLKTKFPERIGGKTFDEIKRINFDCLEKENADFREAFLMISEMLKRSLD